MAPQQWLRTRAAEDYLCRSKRTLLRYVERGLLENGIHFIKAPSDSGKGHWLWNAPAIQDVLKQQSVTTAPASQEAE